MSPTGLDTNDGLSASTPVLTTTRALAILTNLSSTPQTVYLRAGTYPRLVFGSSKNGTPTGPITIRNYPGERALIAPSVGTTKYTWEYALQCSGSYWRIEAEAPSNRRDWSTYRIAVDGGCTGVINRTGIEYQRGAGYVANDYIRGMSGVQMQGNATTATITAGTATTSAEVVNVGVRHCKKWGVFINGIQGPNRIEGCLAYKVVMENIRQWYNDYGANGTPSLGWSYGFGISSGTTIWSEINTTRLAGPNIIRNNIVDHAWGESLGCIATEDTTIQGNLIIEWHRLGIYCDANIRLQVIDNDILQPSNPDINDYVGSWAGIVWSSEKPAKVTQNLLIARNRIVGGFTGIVFGYSKHGGLTPNNVMHAHNVCVGQSEKAVSGTGDPIDDATVGFINNAFDGPVVPIANGYWRRNAFTATPSALCLSFGGFVNSDLRISKGTPLTKDGYTKEYCRPIAGTSPLLERGVVIASTPVGSVAADTEGNTYEPTPTIGPFRSAAVITSTVAASGIALFFGGATPTSVVTVNELEIAETVGGADITDTATVRGTNGITDIIRLTNGFLTAATAMPGDSSVLLTFPTTKNIAEIRVNSSSDQTAPLYLAAFAVVYDRGRPRLNRIGDWKSGDKDSAGWLSFVVSVDSKTVIERARASAITLF
jgi:hypothetical protein